MKGKWFLALMCFLFVVFSYASCYYSLVSGAGIGFGILSMLSGLAFFILESINKSILIKIKTHIINILWQTMK